MVLDNINNSLDLIEKHLNQAYFQTWRYVQLRMGYGRRRCIGRGRRKRYWKMPSADGKWQENLTIDGL